MQFGRRDTGVQGEGGVLPDNGGKTEGVGSDVYRDGERGLKFVARVMEYTSVPLIGMAMGILTPTRVTSIGQGVDNMIANWGLMIGVVALIASATFVKGMLE